MKNLKIILSYLLVAIIASMVTLAVFCPTPEEEGYNKLDELTHLIDTYFIGEADHVIQEEDIRQFRRINERSKLVYIPGATHRFLEEGAWDMVLDLTRDWFEFEQVLVSDWEYHFTARGICRGLFSWNDLLFFTFGVK